MAKDFQIETVDPRDPVAGRTQVTIPHSLILAYFKRWPVRYMNLKAAKEVLQEPQRIFYGVREYNQGGWCFTGRPATWHIREQIEAPFPEDLVFAVYMNPLLYVYETRAEYAAEDDTLCPKDWQARYGGLVWRNTS